MVQSRCQWRSWIRKFPASCLIVPFLVLSVITKTRADLWKVVQTELDWVIRREGYSVVEIKTSAWGLLILLHQPLAKSLSRLLLDVKFSSFFSICDPMLSLTCSQDLHCEMVRHAIAPFRWALKILQVLCCCSSARDFINQDPNGIPPCGYMEDVGKFVFETCTPVSFCVLVCWVRWL